MYGPKLRSLVETTLVACVLLSLSVSTGLAAGKPVKLRAGAVAVDVTPQEFPLNMPGKFGVNMADSAHDPLHARALVLE